MVGSRLGEFWRWWWRLVRLRARLLEGLRVNKRRGMEGNKLGVLGGEGGLLFLHLDGFEPFLTGRETAVLGLGEEAGLDVGPFLLPAVITEEVAQGEHGVDVTTLPVHAGALEPRLDDQLVGTLDHAAADGPALLAEAGILQLCLALLEVGIVRPERLVVRVQLAQATQLGQQWPWSLGLQALLPVLGPS